MAYLTRYPTAAETVSETGYSGITWTSPTNIYDNDDANASITSPSFDSGVKSYVLKAYTFDFSALPAGSVIDGVEVVVGARYANAAGSIVLCQLLNASRARVGDNKAATPQALTTTETPYTFGASDSLWGNSLTESWVKDADFGVGIACNADANNCDVFIDYVYINVHYHNSVTISGPAANTGQFNQVDPTVTAGSPHEDVSVTPDHIAAQVSASGFISQVTTTYIPSPIDGQSSAVDPTYAGPAAASVTVTPDPITSLFSVVAPIVTAAANIIAQAIQGLFSTLVPVVAGAALVIPTNIAGQFSQPTPTIAGNCVVAPSPITGAFSLLEPTVSATKSVSVSSAPIAGQFSLAEPSMSAASSATIVPAPITGQFSILAPTVSAGASAAPSFIAGAFSALDPSAKIQVSTSPTELAGSFSLAEPTISAGGSVSVVPAPISGEFSAGSFVAQIATTYILSAVMGEFSSADPTISAGGSASISPAFIAGQFSVVDPIVSAGGSASVSPSVNHIAGAFDILGDPSISVGSLAVADAEITGAFSLVAPTVVIGETIVSADVPAGTFAVVDPIIILGLIYQASPITAALSIEPISFVLYSPVQVSPIYGAFDLPAPSVQVISVMPGMSYGQFTVPNNPTSHISVDYRPAPIDLIASIPDLSIAPLELNGTFSLISPLVIATGEGQVYLSEPEIDGSFSIASSPVSHVSQRYVPGPVDSGFSIVEPSVSDGSIEVPVNPQTGAFSIANDPHSHVSTIIVPAPLEMAGSILQSAWAFVTVSLEPIDATLSVAPYIDVDLDISFVLEEISGSLSLPEAVVLRNLNTFIHADTLDFLGTCVPVGYIFVPEVVRFHICLESSICTFIDLESNILTDLDLSSNILIE